MSGASDFSLSEREFAYIFSSLKDNELEDFNRESLEDADSMKRNGKLFYVLYKKLFSLTSKGSQPLLSLKDFPFSYTELPPLLVKDDPVIDEKYYNSQAKSRDLKDSTFYFDVFSREWQRFVHIYTNNSMQVIDYSYPPEQKLFSLWIDFDYKIERNLQQEYEQKLDFKIDFRKHESLSMQQFVVFQNIFGKSNQKCMVVEFKYKTDQKEMEKFLESTEEFEIPSKIKTKFMYNPKGKLIENENIEAHLSSVSPATLLTVDTSKNPAQISLSNVGFLRNTNVPFQIYVLVTKNKHVYREGTISYKPKYTKINKSTDTIDATTTSLVIHKKQDDREDYQDSTTEQPDRQKSRLIIQK